MRKPMRCIAVGRTLDPHRSLAHALARLDLADACFAEHEHLRGDDRELIRRKHDPRVWLRRFKAPCGTPLDRADAAALRAAYQRLPPGGRNARLREALQAAIFLREEGEPLVASPAPCGAL